MKKRMLKRVIVAVLSSVLFLTCIMTDIAEASGKENKALAIPYSFENLTWNKNGEKCGQTNAYTICLPGVSKKISVKGLKMGAVVYIPKKVLKKKGASVDFGFHMDLGIENRVLGTTRPGVTIILVNENGKVKMLAWDEGKQKLVKASKYSVIKSGKGKYKDYYVVTLKNIPLHGAMTKAGSDKEVAIDFKTKYAIMGVDLVITGQAYKTSGTMYLDEYTIMFGSKKIVNHTFSKKPKFYDVWNRDKAMSHKKIKIVKL